MKQDAKLINKYQRKRVTCASTSDVPWLACNFPSKALLRVSCNPVTSRAGRSYRADTPSWHMQKRHVLSWRAGTERPVLLLLLLLPGMAGMYWANVSVLPAWLRFALLRRRLAAAFSF